MLHRFSSYALLIILSLMAAACGQSGKVYPLTLEDTRALLTASSELDILVMPGKILELNSTESNDTLLVWDVRDGGEPLIRFKAALSPENALSTRVALSLEAGPSAKQNEIQQRLNDKPTIPKLYLAAMEEAVGAKIERRGFNYTAISSQTMAATTANIGDIHRQMDKGMEEAAKRDTSRSHSVYNSSSTAYDRSESAYDRERRLEKQTAPSVDLSKYNRSY